MRKASVLLASAASLLSFGLAAPAFGITIDGTAEPAYGAAVSVQATQTQFGDNGVNHPGYANGSELDAAYAQVSGGVLFLTLAGNLESNFNKLEIFFDTAAGGQNKLRGDNPNVDFNGLNRMGDDGSGNGLTFDSGFEADYWIGLTVGGANPDLYANYSELLTGGGGSGYYLGQGTVVSGGALSGGSNPNGILVTLDNHNVAGVNSGCDAASGAGIATGWELAVPLAALGSPTGCWRICTFVNGGGHDFLSNQVLGPLLPSQCNLGEPRAVNFNQYPGAQLFQVCDGTVAVQPDTWTNVKSLFR